MADIEKVVNGLKHCTTSLGCFECPYSVLDERSIECQVQIDRDALELLKEQQAIIDSLLKVGYPHNFQREEPWIVDYMRKITKVVEKAVHLRNKGRDGEQREQVSL